MKIAHLLLIHKDPDQVYRLIQLLSSDNCDIYIHLDKKNNQKDYAHLANNKNVFFIQNNIKVYWAAYSLVRCVLNSFKEILLKNYDYINVISGQDLPIKKPSQLSEFLTINKGREFILCNSIDDEWPEAKIRIESYDLPGVRMKGKYLLLSFLNAVLPKKKFPLDYKIVGGSNWFTITPAAAAYILKTLTENPKIAKYCKWTWASDEIVFSTLLYNSSFKNNIVNHLLYVDWGGKHDGHPKILTISDFEELKNTNKFFARKFDKTVDNEIINKIELLVKE